MDKRLDHAAKILVIAGAGADGRGLVQMLQQAGGCGVSSFATLETAPALLDRLEPDLVLIDLRDGSHGEVRLVRDWRNRRGAAAACPVVAVTHALTGAVKADLISAGISDYLAEPFDRWDILFRLGNLLDLQMMRRRVIEQDRAVEDALAYLAGHLEDARSGFAETLARRAAGQVPAGAQH